MYDYAAVIRQFVAEVRTAARMCYTRHLTDKRLKLTLISDVQLSQYSLRMQRWQPREHTALVGQIYLLF